MKNFFINMFVGTGGTSHKRVLGTIGFISLVVYLFICKEENKMATISAIEYLTIATVFGTVVEKFVPKSKD